MSPINVIFRELFQPKRKKKYSRQYRKNGNYNKKVKESIKVSEEKKLNEEITADNADFTKEAVFGDDLNSAKQDNNFLLSQIDEFREKAKQLQELMLAKEKKAKELQSIVDEKDAKAKEMELELEEKKKIASGLTAAMESKIDGLVSEVKDNLNENKEQTKASLDEVSGKLDAVKTELEEKIHSEDVLCYRNMQSLVEEADKKIEELNRKVNELSQKNGNSKLTLLAFLNLVGVVILILAHYGMI
ncbi:MAG: hypothetical protein K6E13_01870 [Lachnospiraceae bacterium]|nr:hypothetical protein [Lachnospiraceae bacterium]